MDHSLPLEGVPGQFLSSTALHNTNQRAAGFMTSVSKNDSDEKYLVFILLQPRRVLHGTRLGTNFFRVGSQEAHVAKNGKQTTDEKEDEREWDFDDYNVCGFTERTINEEEWKVLVKDAIVLQEVLFLFVGNGGDV
ncbi:hypothetical protein NDU88_005841 [Pleurodeles waltl]|uniref:Uncharacterized protein n=1 Tax=Pleurodeles waltl TaxID=8319 RepID=A0AAV7SMV6_PLEWA|nr:hypothetical protein NDU88_005841 [Pleurodeles waltl]